MAIMLMPMPREEEDEGKRASQPSQNQTPQYTNAFGAKWGERKR
jgi:hypothetical protein